MPEDDYAQESACQEIDDEFWNVIQNNAVAKLYYADWARNPAGDPFCNGPVRIGK